MPMFLASSSVLQQIDSLKSEIRSYKESVDSKYNSIRWTIVKATVILSIVIMIVGLAGGGS